MSISEKWYDGGVMSLTKKIAYNTVIQIGGKLLGLILSIITVGILTRYLGVAGFGAYTTIIAYLQIFSILIDFGLQMTTVQAISDPREDESSLMSNILTMRLVSATIFLLLSPIIALFFPYTNEIKIGIAIASFFFFFIVSGNVLIALFQKHLLMAQVVKADFLHKLLFLILVFGVVKFDLGIFGVLIAMIFTGFLYFSLLFYFAQKITKLHFAFEKNTWIRVVKKTWPIAVTIALNLVYFKADTVILAIYRSQAEVGLYGAPYRILEVLIGLSYLFLGLLLPLMTKAYALKQYNRFVNILQNGFDVLIIAIIPMIVGTLFLGREMMVVVSGPAFAVSGDILKILIFATAAIFLAGLFGYAVVAMEKQKQMIPFYMINAILSLIGYILFIPRYSYWAAAYITIFTEVFILATAYAVVSKEIKFSPQLKVAGKALLASGIMSIPLFALREKNFGLAFIIAAGIYLIVLFLLKGIPKQVIRDIINKRT